MTYGRDCQLDNEEKPKDRSSDLLDSISIAAFDVDGRIFRTVWHSLVRAPDVAQAALSGDYTRYIAPIRLFVALFGLQFVVASLFGTPLTGDLSQLSAELEPDQVRAWLAQGETRTGDPVTVGAVDRAMEEWGSIFLWPITIISSLPYLLALKLYRPSIPIWGHVQIYLTSTNASFLFMILTIPLLAFSYAVFLSAVMVGMVIYFIVMGWLVARFYSRSVAGTVWRIIGLLALVPIALVLSSAGQLLGVAWIFDHFFNLSFAELMRLY